MKPLRIFISSVQKEFAEERRALRCREAGLAEPGFAISDGFVTTIWRKGGDGAAAQPESQPESMELRVLALLANGPLAKAAISTEKGLALLATQRKGKRS